MSRLFTLVLLLISVYSSAQVICGTADENGVITLTAPPGETFTAIEFASYGTPAGTCGSFTIGPCHAANSMSICSSIFVGMNSASIIASNDVFGDPCGGTPKRLYVQARYSSTLPLTLISFTAKKIGQGKVRLDWVSEEEVNTSHFVIERSTDGVLFEATGSVSATGGGAYNFTNTLTVILPTYYYRLKMVDIDGKYQYSTIVRINNGAANVRLSVFPNPATQFITIIIDRKQEAVIINSTGQLIRRIGLVGGSQTLNIATWNPGLYLMKAGEEMVKFVKQ